MTDHDETGWLNQERGQYLLRRDEGGRWQLEFGVVAGWRARRLLGRRVRICGTRIGFDVLSVRALGPLYELRATLRSRVSQCLALQISDAFGAADFASVLQAAGVRVAACQGEMNPRRARRAAQKFVRRAVPRAAVAGARPESGPLRRVSLFHKEPEHLPRGVRSGGVDV